MSEAAQPVGGQVKRGDIGTCERQLRGLAAWRGAKVCDPLAADVAEKFRRKAGGRILHPPIALREAGKSGKCAIDATEADGACWQRNAA